MLVIQEKLEHSLADYISKINFSFDINEVSERTAMGLPGGVVDDYSDILEKLCKKLRRKSTESLVSLIQDKSTWYCEKIAAGQLLALIGDPRIPACPNFIDIPGGEAIIGIPLSEVDTIFERYKSFGIKRNWIEKEAPMYKSILKNFKIAEYPITNSQYRQFLLDTKYQHLPSSWQYGQYPQHLSNHPVYTVSIEDAQAYCRWISNKLGKQINLPSEEQWEYCCNLGKYQQYTWGDKYILGAANTNELLLQSTTPVGIFSLSHTLHGVADMLGNVEEYTRTKYFAYPGGKIIEDDLFKKLGYYPIVKGGAFNRFSDLARIQRRHGAYPSSLYAIGFRVVID